MSVSTAPAVKEVTECFLFCDVSLNDIRVFLFLEDIQNSAERHVTTESI